jgi:hypothetical protein
VRKKIDKSNWAIGGGIIEGLGVGLFMQYYNPMVVPAFTLLGLGIDLVMTSIISREKR